ncbi:MAG TPA: DUF6036 family nucleotidyltransferase, partial [Iamia sp.]|nr:DUF6036 family nucleotidyltransferase [Iamia sp.]
MDRSVVEEALHTLGELLDERDQRFSLLVIGGSSLLLLGWTQRATADVDVVAIRSGAAYQSAEHLPRPLLDAVAEVGRTLDLGERWLNSGPAGLLELGLLEGFADRVEIHHFAGLEVHLPGRIDLVAFKLFAAADLYPANRKHVQDLQALDVTGAELAVAAEWARSHDDSPGFAELLRL